MNTAVPVAAPTSSEIVSDATYGSMAFVGSDFNTGSAVLNSLPGMLSFNITSQLHQFLNLIGIS
ncbi:hypothetical protein [Corynebacterium sp.]|uniref:hypothetical protein n=1 Tax=Corynebacterium sp. TaxID=1720 RepID=UPI0026DC500E|nr:hypothetical protein [Corynebacterium sp.]MDO5076620.1 hypothetical protein [Corynebacterium sp.]